MRHMILFLTGLMAFSGCAMSPTLPDEAAMNAPPNPRDVLILPKYPAQGRKFLVQRDREEEIWLVKDTEGTIEFLDLKSREVKFSIKLGPCFSFSVLQGPGSSTHNFGAMGKPAYHTVPEDCKVWDGRTWTQTYAVQMPRLPQPCYYGARRRAKVEGPPGDRLVTSDSSVEITGPGVRGGIARTDYRLVYSEKLNFFKELSPGYIGRKTVVIRELKE